MKLWQLALATVLAAALAGFAVASLGGWLERDPVRAAGVTFGKDWRTGASAPQRQRPEGHSGR